MIQNSSFHEKKANLHKNKKHAKLGNINYHLQKTY